MSKAVPKNVIIVWYDPIKGAFEDNIPLLWNAKRNHNLGSKNLITVIFLSGMNDLNKNYIKDLQDAGYELVDASKIYLGCAKKYRNLDRFGDYEKRCFLRWVILDILYPSHDLIHYDGDIVWDVTLEIISEIVLDKTFVLDGCPAFTVIADHCWLKTYISQLNIFAKNPAEYGSDWRETQFRKQIRSDQDLIDYLLQKKLLPQDVVPRSKYQFVENPLSLHGKNQNNLAFWHMQTDYIHYLNLKYMLAPYGLSRFAPNPLTTPKGVLKIIYLLGRIVGRGYQSRLSIYKYFFDKSDKSDR